MKFKFIILCIISFLCMETLNAQSSEPRSNKFKYKNIEEYKISNENRRIYVQSVYNNSALYDEYSLKNYPDKNLIEINLLDKYEDIIVNKWQRVYYILDSVGNIGIANANGEVLVPPISGKVRFVRNHILLGEETDELDDITMFLSELNEDFAISMGLCKAVVEINPILNTINVIIPFNKYDYISNRLRNDVLNPIIGFYVVKIDENNSVLWGCCDKEGKEMIPCEYTGVLFDGVGFQGDNTKDMSEWNANVVSNIESIVSSNDLDYTYDSTDLKICKIGDYYNEHGKQGVVFEVSEDGKHGKIVSLDYTKAPWNAHKVKGCEFKGNSKTNVNDLYDGMKNTDMILAREDAELYLAFLWCREKGADWYLPSQNELRKIYEERNILNETIAREGGEVLAGWYFSSTEPNYLIKGKSYSLNFAAVISMNIGIYNVGAKNDFFVVRAVATF